MRNETLKRMFDACYQAKRARDLLPPLPNGVTSSYIHYLDCMRELEEKGKQVRISDLSEFLNIPRPGVTRTVKEMTAKGYLTKTASEEDGRVTYLTITEAGRKLWEIYDGQYFAALQPALEDIPDEDAEAMIRTIEKLYQVMSERRGKL